MKIEMNKTISFMLVMLLCAIAVPALITEKAMAAAGDRPIHGFVSYDSNDTLVGNGITVTGREGATVFDINTTFGGSGYVIQNGDGQVDGDVIVISVSFVADAVTYTGSITLTLGFEETLVNHNISVSAVTVASYDAAFRCVDTDGAGVAGVNISVRNALGTYFNETTNATGYATVADLPVGAYTYTVGLNASDLALGLHNRTGSFSIVDRDVPILINLSQADASDNLSILGISVSKYCLLVIVVVVAVALGYLFVRNINKHGHEAEK